MASAVALAGCQTDGIDLAKAMKPLSAQMTALVEEKGMSKESPILVRAFKEESELEVWKQDRNGEYALLKTYPICRWSGELGPKIREGDRQAPEGFYNITPAQMNPRSQFYLSFNLGYPNAFDKAHGRTGAHLMVHGDCSSRGCYSMTDEQIAEIYALGRDSFFGGQKSFQVQAYPFRMTPLNMAKHRNSPHMAFWKMLKEGNDHFELTRAEPKVDVCEKRYVFNASEPAGSTTPLNFQAAGRCPVFQVPTEIASEVASKSKRDELAFADFVRRGTSTVPVKTGRDGGMHEVFLAKLQGAHEIRDSDGNLRMVVENKAPGTLPAHATPPRDPQFEPSTVGAIQIANVPMPRPVPGRASAMAAAPSQGTAAAAYATADTKNGAATGSLFTGLVSTGASTTGTLGRAASSVTRFLGFGGEEAKPPPKVAQPRRAPAQRQAENPAAVAAAPKTEPQAKATQQQTAEATTPARPSAGASLMNGAQPVVSTGGFETRWPSGLR